METGIISAPPERVPMSVEEVVEQVSLIQQIQQKVMKQGEHFGTIPGCGNKPTLFKAGAEKLAMTFRLVPTYQVEERKEPSGHREYRVSCTVSTSSGAVVAQGGGTCTTLERKYRYRMESTEKPVPKEYWSSRDPVHLGGSNFKAEKRGGNWVVVERVEHDSPADYYNTALKMAYKRAFVAAILTATAASDIFAQDLEDLSGNGDAPEPQAQNNPKKQESAHGGMPELPPHMVDAPPPSSAHLGDISTKQIGMIRGKGREVGFQDDAAILAGICTFLKEEITSLGALNKEEGKKIIDALLDGTLHPQER